MDQPTQCGRWVAGRRDADERLDEPFHLPGQGLDHIVAHGVTGGLGPASAGCPWKPATCLVVMWSVRGSRAGSVGGSSTGYQRRSCTTPITSRVASGSTSTRMKPRLLWPTVRRAVALVASARRLPR